MQQLFGLQAGLRQPRMQRRLPVMLLQFGLRLRLELRMQFRLRLRIYTRSRCNGTYRPYRSYRSDRACRRKHCRPYRTHGSYRA